MEYKKHIFSSTEKSLFIDILRKYSEIVESKKTDSSSLQQKNAAWEEITKAYNASPQTSYPVTSKQLRRLWMNMKQRQRDILTIERQHRLATGGGPSTSNGDSALDPDISGITNDLLVCVNGAIDSDTATELIVIDGNENQPIHPLSPDPTIPEIEIQTPIPIQSALKSNDLPKTNFNKAKILEYEYYDRKKRFDELHDIELRIMKEKLREAKARADLANLVYEKEKVVFSN